MWIGYHDENGKLVYTSPRFPLPVRIAGSQEGAALGTSTWVELNASLGITTSFTDEQTLLTDYTPATRYQTLAWVVQVTSNAALRIRIEARLNPSASYLTVAEYTIPATPGGALFILPVDGFYAQYRFRAGQTGSNPGFYGRLIAY